MAERVREAPSRPLRVFRALRLKEFFRTAAVRGGADAGVDMQPAELGAAMQLRKHLAGVQETVRVKAHLRRCCWARSTSSNIVPSGPFFDADPMFASQYAPTFTQSLRYRRQMPPPARFRRLVASYRISGCRLPSPAWKTLATRSRARSIIRRSGQDLGEPAARDRAGPCSSNRARSARPPESRLAPGRRRAARLRSG